MNRILSCKEGLGCVALCANCADVHLSVGNVAIRLTQEAFEALSGMVGEAARALASRAAALDRRRVERFAPPTTLN